MGLTKEQIEEFVEREKEACDTWDYLDLATDYLSIDKSYSDDALNKAENLAESFMDFKCLVEFYLEQEKIDKSKVADYCLKAEKLAESFSDFTDLAQFYCHEGNIDKVKATDYCLKAEKLAESSRDFTDLAKFYCQEGNIDTSKAKDYYLKALKKSENNLSDMLSVFYYVQLDLKDDEFLKEILLTCEKTIDKSHNFEDIMSRLSSFIHDVQKLGDEVLTSNLHHKIIDIFTEVVKDNTLNGEKQNLNICFQSSLICDMNNCFETILKYIFHSEGFPSNNYTEVSKRWINLLLDLEQKSSTTYDFRDLGCMAVRRYTPSIDGDNTTAKSLANGWFEKGISIAQDIESLISLYTEMTCEGYFPVSEKLEGKIVEKILDLAETFKDYQSIVTSEIQIHSIDGTPISETAIDMAIKLKGEATKEELENFIFHLEEYELSDRVDELK